MSIFKSFSRAVMAAGLVWTGAVFAQGEQPQWNVGVSNNPNGGAAAVVATLEGTTLTIAGTGAMQNFSLASSTPWFSHMNSIVDVIIEDGVTNIGNTSFYESASIRSIAIPNSVTSIGQFAFSRSSLESLDIPAAVTTIGDNAISFLHNLTYINVAEGNTAFSSIDGVLFDASQEMLYLYPPNREGASYTIPNSVKTLRNQSFQHSRNLTTVTIPEGVTNAAFDQNTFAFMSALTSVTLPNSMTFVNTTMFGGSGALKSITLGTGVTLVNRGALQNCTALESITFLGTTPPETPQGALWSFMSTNDMDSSAIKLYAPLEALEAYREHDIWGKFHSVSPIPNPTWACGVNVNCSFNAGIFKVSGTGRMTDYLPAAGTPALMKSASEISPATTAPWASYKPYITSIIIEDGVTSIGNAAFEGSDNLTSVKIGSNVTSIGAFAFQNCANIDSIQILSAAPPTIEATTFIGVDMSSAALFVPEASLEAYTDATGWGEFQDIEAIANSSVRGGTAINRTRTNSLSPAVSVRGKTLNVKTLSSTQNLQVRMIDMRGRTMTRFDMIGGGNISLNKISAGRYLVDMRDMETGRRFTSPIIVR